MAGSKRGSGATPAMLALDRAGISYQTRPYHHDPSHASYGMEAAQALGVAPQRVFKTLVIEVDGGPAVAIVPVDRQLDLKAVAAVLGGKRAGMAPPKMAERVTGYVVGGISPIGQKQRLPTVLDASAGEHETILISGGKRGLDLELSPDDLVEVSEATVARILR